MVYSILNVISKETEIDKDSWGVLIIAAIAHDVGTVVLNLKHTKNLIITC